MAVRREERIYNLIKKIKENYKELLLIFILYSSYLKNNRKLKNPTLVNILQEYLVPHSHTYSEAVKTIPFKQNTLMILLFCQNWTRCVTLA